MMWQPIETAPKDGTEFIGYRHDSGSFVCRWASMEEFVPHDIYGDPTEDYADYEWWFCDRYGWLEGLETPEIWTPMPVPPEAE